MEKLLKTKANLIIFGDKALKQFVWLHRQKQNTVFVDMTMDDIYQKWFATRVANLRNQRVSWPFFEYKVNWQNFVKDYNVIINTKMEIVHQAAKMNPFQTDYIFWIDAGFFHLIDYEENFISKTQTDFLNLVQGLWTHHTYENWNYRFSGYKNNPS